MEQSVVMTPPLRGLRDWLRVGRAHGYGALVVFTFVVLPVQILVRVAPQASLGDRVLFDVLGAVVIAAGAVLAYSSFWVFVRYGNGTAFWTEPPQVLVIRGPYRYARNPMYAGNVLMVVGQAVLFESLWVGAYAVLLAGAVDRWVIRAEERVLTSRYGDPYRRYLAHIRRWMPTRTPYEAA